MTDELPPGFVTYLRSRQLEQNQRVVAMINDLSERELALVREAAIMGFVRGNMTPTGTIPPDSQILTEVLTCCDGHNLYPTISKLGRP